LRRQDAETMKILLKSLSDMFHLIAVTVEPLVESLRLPCPPLAIASGRHNGGGSRRKAQDRHFSTISSATSKVMKISVKNVQEMV
jgi:hypothetical protein